MGKQQLSPAVAVVVVLVVVVVVGVLGYFLFLRPKAEQPLAKPVPTPDEMMGKMKDTMQGTTPGGPAGPAGAAQPAGGVAPGSSK